MCLMNSRMFNARALIYKILVKIHTKCIIVRRRCLFRTRSSKLLKSYKNLIL